MPLLIGRLMLALLLGFFPLACQQVFVPVSALREESPDAETTDASDVSISTRGQGATPTPATLFVAQETPDGPIAEERRVTVGRRADGQVEVFDGLQAGERVVVRSARPLQPGTRLRLSAISQDARGGEGTP